MCGIAGLVGEGVAERTAVLDAVGAMVTALGHRGPDAHGTWATDGACLGHSRLTILDLSESGNQPLRSEHLALTYNGEIYNFRELRDGLDGPFRSTGDSEVLLRAFEARGVDCLPELLGMFAFGIWDSRRRSLVLARDRLGIKPLYYRHLGERLAFCSEVGPLVQLEPAELEPQALADYLLYGYVPTPHTPWRGIHKLPPAHYLEFRDGEIRLERYWQLEPRVEIENLGEAREAFGPLLERVVRDHLIADVPVGLFRSSGIDSSMLATFLAGNRSFTL
ncbi:MAG: asparagine synthetase B, partial [Holophagales bacterium]|nr:asparagine synthetase B [Holophagales bacterium]